MVQNHQVQKMEEEEDLEALRLAALQTIRSRKGSRRPIAPVTAHRQLEKQSFCRHVTNPNLIAIVPTDPRTEIESSEPSSICNGSSEIVENPRISVRNKTNTVKKHEDGRDKIVKEKPRVCLNKNIPEQSKDVKEEVAENSKKDVEGSVSELPESVDNPGNLNFDEDVLDFEGDTVMLHDDDDSLDRLMDEMEQEFSQETVPNKSNSSGQSKLKEAKNSKKISISLTSKETNIRNSSPSTVTNAPSSLSSAPDNKTRSRSPSPRNSLKSSSASPSNTRSPPSSRKRYSSPSPPPRRRSPYSPRLKRRRSQTPPPRRYSRSPSRYGRNRSPYKYNGRRNSVSPRRRNNSSSPSRRYINRASPPRRKFSPTIMKRKSSSPGIGRHRRSPKRSPNRNISEAESRHHRWKSPHHKKIVSLHKRELSTRIPKNIAKASSPVQRIPDENKSDKNEKKFIVNKVQDNAELAEPDIKKPSSEPLDPKLEARRRKFESSVYVNPSNKKICLKSSAETAIKKIDKRKDHQKVSFPNKEDNNLQITSTSSKANVESAVIKHFPQELSTGRRVTEMTKRDSSVQAGHGLKKKKRIVLNEDGNPQSIRLELTSEPVSEIRKKSKLKHSVIKFNEDNNKEIKKLKTEKQLSEFENEINENTLIVKKVSKKKRKNKELKKKREIMLDLVQNEVIEKPEEVNISDEEEIIEKKDTEEVNAVPPKVKSNITKQGDDLRAEISRRRAERLKGVTNPMARIIQSAFEDVVANRKKFETRRTAAAQDKEKKPPTSSGVLFKSKGNRRVHVLEEPSTKTTPQYTDKESSNESSELEDYSDDSESRNYDINLSNQRSSTLRTASSGSGRSILRRSQV